MTFAGCDVGCVLQIAGVVTPCLQRIQDAVSVVAISSGGRQTAGVIGQLGPMLGEKGLLCEGMAATRAALRASELSWPRKGWTAEKITGRRSRNARIPSYSSRNRSPAGNRR